MGRKAALAAFAAVLLVAAIPVLVHLAKPREVISSTPSAYTGLTVPLPVPAKGVACVQDLAFDTDSAIARFGAGSAPGGPAPALRVVAQGAGYTSAAVVPGGWTGTRQLDVRLRPPGSAVFGTLCIHALGRRPVNLVGSQDGRAASRPSVVVDGQASPIELQLRFLAPGRHSLLSRTGTVTRHAATLKPFGAWWIWLLALALLTLAPLAVGAAVQTALRADEAVAGTRPRLVFSAERARRWGAAVPGWAIVAGVGVLSVLWLCYWGFSTHAFQNDEDQYVYLSRWLRTDLPSTLFQFTVYGRGLQRLEIWLLAIPGALFDAPWALQGGRLLNTLAFVSTAIPVYKLGRGLGLSARWAALPAALSMVVPWAVVTTGFFSENVAYPACLWAIWGIWRAATGRGVERDVAALALLLVAGLARSGLLILAPVLPLVVAGTGLRCGEGGPGARVRALLRGHVVLWAIVAAGLLALVLSALGQPTAHAFVQHLSGGYVTQTSLTSGVFAKAGKFFAKVVIGTGFLPTAVALPWLALELARGRDPRRFGFALTVVLGALALLYSLNTAGLDERYIVYLGPLVLLPATLALARREISPAGLAIASVLLALLVWRVPWNSEQGPYAFFVVPVEMFFSRGIGLKFAQYLPGDAGDVLALAALLLGLLGIAVAVLLRRAPLWLAGVPGAVLVALVVLSVPLQTEYALSRYVNGAGAKAGPSVRDRAFVDTTVPAGATVGEFAEGAGQTPAFFPLWQEVQFYNQRIDRTFSVGDTVVPVAPGDSETTGVRWDPRTGLVHSPTPLPDYVVIPDAVGFARLRGRIIASPSYVAVSLMKLDKPARLAFSAVGFDGLGASGPKGGRIRFYAGGAAGPRCAVFTLLGGPTGTTRARISRPGAPAIVTALKPGETRAVSVPLPGLSRRGYLDVRLRGPGVRLAFLSGPQRC
jgi:hypothetical protein